MLNYIARLFTGPGSIRAVLSDLAAVACLCALVPAVLILGVLLS